MSIMKCWACAAPRQATGRIANLTAITLVFSIAKKNSESIDAMRWACVQRSLHDWTSGQESPDGPGARSDNQVQRHSGKRIFNRREKPTTRGAVSALLRICTSAGPEFTRRGRRPAGNERSCVHCSRWSRAHSVMRVRTPARSSSVSSSAVFSRISSVSRFRATPERESQK